MATIKDLLSNMISKIHTKMDNPAGAEPNQQLVTDGTGAVKWEDKAFYNEGYLTLKLSPEFDTFMSSSSSLFETGCYRGGVDSNDATQVEMAKRMGNELWNPDGSINSNYETWVFYLDGVRYESPRRRLPAVFYPGDLFPDNIGVQLFYAASNYQFAVWYNDNKEHTFQLELAQPIVKPISPKYLTGTELTEADNGKVLGVENGQVALVKQSNGLPEGSEPYKQLVTDGEGKTVWDDRLAYIKTVEVSLLNDATVEIRSPEEEPDELTLTEGIIQGDKCIVTFDGVTYECVAYSPKGSDGSSVFIGNASLFPVPIGSGGNGEPFVINVYGTTAIMLAETTGEHTISISAQQTVVNKIPYKYIPTIVLETNGNGNYQCNVPYDEFYDMIMLGAPIVYIRSGGESKVSNLVTVTASDKGADVYIVVYGETSYTYPEEIDRLVYSKADGLYHFEIG